MKLRSLVLPGALALALSAWADPVVTSAQMLGLMNVPSTAANTMIAVPWLGVGGENVKVCDLVKTDTLSAGDQLYYYHASGTYDAWTLTGGAWTPIATAGTANGVTTAVPAANQTIARGKALWLVRSDTSKEIWIYGQCAASAAAVTITANACNMIANPLATAFNFSGIVGAAGDEIVIPDGTATPVRFTYENNAWGKLVTEKTQIGTTGKYVVRTSRDTTAANCLIPAGQGCWYVSKGGTPTFTWQ